MEVWELIREDVNSIMIVMGSHREKPKGRRARFANSSKITIAGLLHFDPDGTDHDDEDEHGGLMKWVERGMERYGVTAREHGDCCSDQFEALNTA